MGTWVKYAGTQMTTNVNGFWLYTPTGASANSACIIALHGQGEQGSGSSDDLNLLTTQGLCKLVNDRMGTGIEFPHDALLVFPQYTGGTPSLFRVNGIINYVKSNFTFDQNKLHLTGYSLGAAGVTGWWEIGNLSAVASCSIVATPSTYYSAGAANAVAYNMPTLFIHGDQDVHPTAYAYSVGWVNGLNTDGISPTALLTTLVGSGHNIDETVYDWTSYEVITGKDFAEWHFQFSRGTVTQGTAAGTSTVTGNATALNNNSSGTTSGTATVTGAAKILGKVSGSASGLATTEGQRTYIDVGGTTQVINGQNWIAAQEAQFSGGVFTSVYLIWGDNWNQTIQNTSNQIIYRTQRRTSSGFTVNYPIANGTYTVRLHFCEFWRTTIGENVMNIDIEGSRVKTGLDVLAVSGGRYFAYTEDYPVTVSDGNLTMAFTPTAGSAILNAFEIIAPGADVRLLTGVSGSTSGSAAVTGEATTIGASVEVINGTSSVTGQAVIISLAGGSIAATSDATASAKITTKAAASTEGAASTSAQAKVIAIASGNTSGISTTSVIESGITKMSGSIVSSANGQGQAAVVYMVTGSAVGTSNAFAGALQIAGRILSGTVQQSITHNGSVQQAMNYQTNIA